MVKSKDVLLLRKRELERRWRKKIKENPERLAEENEKRRVRYAARKKEKPRLIESKKMIEDRRRKWRLAKQRQAEKKRPA